MYKDPHYPTLKAKLFNAQDVLVYYDGIPDECPYCHDKINPMLVTAVLNPPSLVVVMQCPSDVCKKNFLAFYNERSKLDKNPYHYIRTTFGTPKQEKFDDIIAQISPKFVEIYNQALYAEELNLIQICGLGYRKALEFLIKDYLILLDPNKETEIKKELLGKCIKMIDNGKLKMIAERAAWLGNDEAHYVRRWEDKDVSDLKKLIRITLHWIEMEEETKNYGISMQ